MESRTYQTIYNLSEAANPSFHKGFDRFPHLPPELRSSIWLHAMQRNRIIKVDLQKPKNRDPPRHIFNSLEKETSGTKYYPTVPRLHIYSRILRVNTEAREEAKRFYSIQMPFLFRTETCQQTVVKVVYLNPDYDFLYFDNIKDTKFEAMIDLFHDLGAYDKRGVGLLNLAANESTLQAWSVLQPRNLLQSSKREVYRETMRQLQEVFWIVITNQGREIGGWLSPQSRGVGIDCRKASTIMPLEPVFDRLGRDPRSASLPSGPINNYTRGATRRMVVLWHRILTTCDIPFTDAVSYRHLVTQQPPFRKICFIRDYRFGSIRNPHVLSSDVVLKESDDWRGGVAELSELERDKHCTWSRAEPVAVFGFWLFPMDENGQGPELGISAVQQ